MSGTEHHVHATADKGLKMKIKRKNVAGVNKAESKHEIVKNEGKNVESANNSGAGVNGQTSDKNKQSTSNSDKSPYKNKSTHKKEKMKEKGGSNMNNKPDRLVNGNISNGLDELFNKVSMEPKIADIAQTVKKEGSLDPYDFNNDDDGITLPTKKVKTEKVESASSPMQVDSHHIGVETCTIGVSTEPDCLGPCEPGTSVNLEGIVWHETENGVLVVNVTWRGKTYVGTLLDATKHDWAPPRFNCDSPVSDFETRTPKGRGKRNRGPPVGTPVVEKVITEGRKLRKGRRGSNVNTFQAPPSPAKSDVSSSGGVKRKGRSADIETKDDPRAKRCRSSSRGPVTPAPAEVSLVPNKDGLIECPEPNCSKKYKHMNGLRYHQTHAHLNPLNSINNEEDMDDKCDEDSKSDVQVKIEKKDSKFDESSEKSSKPTRERENSIEDNIPLKEIAASCRANAHRNSPEKSSDKSEKSDKHSEKSDKKSEKNSDKSSGKSDGQKSSDNSKHDNSSGKKKDNETATSVNSSVTSTSNSVNTTSSVNTSTTSGANTVSNSSGKSTVPSQVYQISGAPVGGLNGTTKVTPSRTSLVSTPIVTASGSPPSNPVPITVSAMATPPHVVDFNKSDKLSDKTKSKTATRPIVPAPSPQMIALSSNVSVSHASSPVSSHTQMSPSLKPIQPKPTIMGEPSHINPALVGLNKDKKSKIRKKKEKDGSTSVVNNNNNIKPLNPKDSHREDATKSERPAVIKSTPNPSKPSERKDKNSMPESGKQVIDMSRKPPTVDVSRPSPNQAITPLNVPKPDQSNNRLPTPSNLMKVNSPLQVSTDRKTPVNDDVQSPAYSDISDANESNGSPQQGDSPSKKEGPKKTEHTPSAQPPPQEGNNVGAYGMYGYYGQSQYMMQSNVPPSQHLSPNTNKPLPQNRDAPTTSSEEKKQGEDLTKTPIKVEEREENKLPKPDMTQRGGPQQMNEYQMQQQKYYQQMYAHIQSLPPHAQYQYVAAYSGYLDPNFQMHLINSDPNLRQQYDKAMEEQKRHQEMSGKPPQDGDPNKKPNSRPASRELQDPQSSKLQQSHLPSPVSSNHPGGNDGKKPGLDRPTDQSIREKQNENHQILKENIELKSQMDRNRYEYDYRKQEEMRRYQMFQQQKLIEQQRLEKRKQEMAATKPPELTSAESPVGKHGPTRPQDVKPEDLVKREHGEPRHRDSSSSKISPDGKSDDKHKSDKLRSPENPRSSSHPPHPNPSPGAPINVQSPAQQGPMPPYNTFMQYPGPYIQSPHYGQMHYDPNQAAMYRNMNPHVLGYAASPYLHPAQMGAQMGGQLNYRLSVETEKEKVIDSKSASVSVESEKSIEGPSAPGYYGNSHKIHELNEKVRPGSHSSSPVPSKNIDSSPHQSMDKTREHSKSPPTQRHIHTHHHTHVVGGYPLVHDTYGAPLLPPQPATSLPHTYNAK